MGKEIKIGGVTLMSYNEGEDLPDEVSVKKETDKKGSYLPSIIDIMAAIELVTSFIIAIWSVHEYTFIVFLSILFIGILNCAILSAISVVVKAAEKYLSEGNNKDVLNK